MSEKPKRRRGVPLNDLDRSKVYLIARVGTRWEVVGEHSGPVPPWDGLGGGCLSGTQGEAGTGRAAPEAGQDGPNSGSRSVVNGSD